MNLLLLLATIAAVLQSEPAPRRVLLITDARFTIPEIVGQVIRVRDFNGDGLSDLFIARGAKHGCVERIDIVSGKDGGLVRTVWTREKQLTREPVWDAGGDADGDGYPDVVIGNGRASSNVGEVLVLSGKTSNVLVRRQGTQPEQRLGASVCWIGDVNADGHDDFAAGSLACDLDYTSFLLGQGKSGGGSTRDFMKEKCALPGDVTVHSGKDGSVLWHATGNAPGAGFGSVMSVAGDIDRDGARELIVQPDLRAGLPASVLSGKTGAVLSTLETMFGPVLVAGDVDADGVEDFILVSMDERIVRYLFSSRIVSGKTRAHLFAVPHPDEFSTHARLVSLGDLDGDGHADVGVGDTYFGVRLGGPNPRSARLGEMTAIESQPRGGLEWESGCAVVYSGKICQPIFGVWAEYGSATGLGFELSRIDDINADGRDDIIVTGHDTAYAFATPPLGEAPK